MSVTSQNVSETIPELLSAIATFCAPYFGDLEQCERCLSWKRVLRDQVQPPRFTCQVLGTPCHICDFEKDTEYPAFDKTSLVEDYEHTQWSVTVFLERIGEEGLGEEGLRAEMEKVKKAADLEELKRQMRNFPSRVQKSFLIEWKDQEESWKGRIGDCTKLTEFLGECHYFEEQVNWNKLAVLRRFSSLCEFVGMLLPSHSKKIQEWAKQAYKHSTGKGGGKRKKSKGEEEEEGEGDSTVSGIVGLLCKLAQMGREHFDVGGVVFQKLKQIQKRNCHRAEAARKAWSDVVKLVGELKKEFESVFEARPDDFAPCTDNIASVAQDHRSESEAVSTSNTNTSSSSSPLSTGDAPASTPNTAQQPPSQAQATGASSPGSDIGMQVEQADSSSSASNASDSSYRESKVDFQGFLATCGQDTEAKEGLGEKNENMLAPAEGDRTSKRACQKRHPAATDEKRKRRRSTEEDTDSDMGPCNDSSGNRASKTSRLSAAASTQLEGGDLEKSAPANKPPLPGSHGPALQAPTQHPDENTPPNATSTAQATRNDAENGPDPSQPSTAVRRLPSSSGAMARRRDTSPVAPAVDARRGPGPLAKESGMAVLESASKLGDSCRTVKSGIRQAESEQKDPGVSVSRSAPDTLRLDSRKLLAPARDSEATGSAGPSQASANALRQEPPPPDALAEIQVAAMDRELSTHTEPAVSHPFSAQTSTESPAHPSPDAPAAAAGLQEQKGVEGRQGELPLRCKRAEAAIWGQEREEGGAKPEGLRQRVEKMEEELFGSNRTPGPIKPRLDALDPDRAPSTGGGGDGLVELSQLASVCQTAETVVFGQADSEEEGGLKQRVNRMEEELFGSARPGALKARLEALDPGRDRELSQFVSRCESAESVLGSDPGEVRGGAGLKRRVEAMEMEVDGKHSSGGIIDRLNGLGLTA